MIKIPYCDNGDSVKTECGIPLFIKEVGRRGATVIVSSMEDAIKMGVDESTLRTNQNPAGGDLYEWEPISASLGGDIMGITVQYLYRPTIVADDTLTWGQLSRGENYLVIFGATDQEVAVARQLCAELGIVTATATYGGKPVHAGNAYEATSYKFDEEDGIRSGFNGVILFECYLPVKGVPVFVCDHHRPGDPGYGKPAEEAVKASSLGQLAEFFGLELNPTQRAVAAADHNLPAAYQGLVPVKYWPTVKELISTWPQKYRIILYQWAKKHKVSLDTKMPSYVFFNLLPEKYRTYKY